LVHDCTINNSINSTKANVSQNLFIATGAAKGSYHIMEATPVYWALSFGENSFFGCPPMREDGRFGSMSA
jgi:hypothetical protein